MPSKIQCFRFQPMLITDIFMLLYSYIIKKIYQHFYSKYNWVLNKYIPEFRKHRPQRDMGNNYVFHLVAFIDHVNCFVLFC